MRGFYILLCLLVVIAYILATFIELIERTNYSIQNRVIENNFTDKNFRFGKEQGFAIAAGFYSTIFD